MVELALEISSRRLDSPPSRCDLSGGGGAWPCLSLDTGRELREETDNRARAFTHHTANRAQVGRAGRSLACDGAPSPGCFRLRPGRVPAGRQTRPALEC